MTAAAPAPRAPRQQPPGAPIARVPVPAAPGQPPAMALLHHALGVRIAISVGETDRARAELDALLDAAAAVEAYLLRPARRSRWDDNP